MPHIDSIFGLPTLQRRILPPQIASESPSAFHVRHEVQIADILHARSPWLVQSLFRFGLFGVTDSLRRTLQDIPVSSLDDILAILQCPEQPSMLQQMQKIEKIIGLVEFDQSNSFSNWRWTPYNGESMHPDDIANEIDTESYRRVQDIHFEDWVRYFATAAGKIIDNLFHEHRLLAYNIHTHICAHRQEREKYVDVSEVSKPACISHFSNYFAEYEKQLSTSTASPPTWSLSGDLFSVTLVLRYEHRKRLRTAQGLS